MIQLPNSTTSKDVLVNENMVELVDIFSIEKCGSHNTVDITVQDDASFCLGSGIISHNSALGIFNDVRDPRIHGALPLRGKILNVTDEKMTPTKLMQSQSIADIMNAIGLIPGQKAIRSELRYGRIMISTDSDEDGKNIQAQVVNFLYSYWPELFDPNKSAFVYIFMTPFIILEKGKQREYFYQDNYHEYNPDDWKGWHARRAKGLGTLQKVDWDYAVNKKLRAIPLVDDGNLEPILDLIFNKKRADDRKVWLTTKAPDEIEYTNSPTDLIIDEVGND